MKKSLGMIIMLALLYIPIANIHAEQREEVIPIGQNPPRGEEQRIDLQGKLAFNHTLRNNQENSNRSEVNLIQLAALEEKDKSGMEDGSNNSASDPLEPINRAFFHFNDKLYFWVLKPVAEGYKAVAPEPVRVSVNNFFNNLGFPIRFVNCLLQAKFEGALTEFTRFMVNSTAGFVGFFDVAKKEMKLERKDEDLGQTFGFYGAGPAIYIHWPFLGASSLRDTIGMCGDTFLNPLTYPDTIYNVSARSYDAINKTSLTIGDYEDLKNSALDPYIAVRDAYYQYRQKKIKE